MPNKPKLTKAQYNAALAIMRGRVGHVEDRRRKAPIAKSYDQWKADPSRYDLKGVDAKRKKRKSGARKPRVAGKRSPTAKQLAALAAGRAKMARSISRSTSTKKTTKKRGTAAGRSAAAKKAAATRARNKYGPAKMPKGYVDTTPTVAYDESTIPSGVSSYGLKNYKQFPGVKYD